MRRILAVILCLLTIPALCACGQDSQTVETVPVTETATEPGATWTLFEAAFLPIARGEVGISQEEVTAFLTEQGYEWSLGEGMLSVLDPEHPGSFLGGPLTTIHGISDVAQLSYHYVIEEGQRIDERVQRAVMVDLVGEKPRYYIDLNWLGEGTEVSTVQEMADYLTDAQ